MEFRKHFGYDVEKASNEAVKVIPEGERSLTVQSMSEDADLNVLMKRFGITGKMPENPRVPMFGDFTGITDFQSALEAVSKAADGFMELPAEIRGRFQNNPQNLLAFCADERNIDEARKLGLLKESGDGGVQSGGSVAAGGGSGAAAAGAVPPVAGAAAKA